MTTQAAVAACAVLAAGVVCAVLMRGSSSAPETEPAAEPRASPPLRRSPAPEAIVPPAPPAKTAVAAPAVSQGRESADGGGDRRATIDRTTREYLDSMTVPPKVLAEARGLGVRDETLRAMYGAELLLHYGGDATGDEALRAATTSALAALAGHGEMGYRAVVANVLGNPSNTSRGDALARATWRPGLETELVDRLRGLPHGAAAMAPLRALGGMDSEVVRVYLREALTTHRDHASNFASAAGALGALRDGESAGAIAEKLRENNWSGLRGSLLDSLGRMGGGEARRVLTDYLREATGDHESQAVRALARIDEAAARAEAETIVRGDGPNRATAVEVGLLRAFLAER